MKSTIKNNSLLKKLAKPFLALTVSLLTLILCDFVIGVAGFSPEVKPIWMSGEKSEESAYRKSKNPILGFELKPDYRNPDADFKHSYPYINSHGFRDIERTIEKTTDKKRIILLGDSVVEGLGVKAIDQMINRQIEIIYPSTKDKMPDYEVLGMGVSGYCTLAEIELLKEKGLEFQPDSVVLIFVENDYDNFIPVGHSLDNMYQRPSYIKHLFIYSNLFRLLSIQFNWYHFGEETDPLKWSQKALGNNNVSDGLKRFSELAEKHNFNAVIAIWPRFTKSEIINRHAIPDNEELIIERLGRLYKIPTVRLSSYFEKDYQNKADNKRTPRHIYTIGDEMHPSPKGCTVAAHGIHDIIKKIDTKSISAGNPVSQEESKELENSLKTINNSKPNYANVHIRKGLSFLEEGNFKDAESEFKLALKANPENAAALFDYGLLYMKTSKFNDAIKMFQKTLDSKPYFRDANLNMGIAYIKSGNPQSALNSFQKEIQISPDNFTAYFNSSLLLTNLKQYEKAQEVLNQGLKVSPENVKALNQFGIIALHLKQWDSAIKYFQKVLKLNPTHKVALKNIEYAKQQRSSQ